MTVSYRNFKNLKLFNLATVFILNLSRNNETQVWLKLNDRCLLFELLLNLSLTQLFYFPHLL